MNPSDTLKLLIIEFDKDLAEILEYSFPEYQLLLPADPVSYDQMVNKEIPDMAIIEVNDITIKFHNTFAHLIKHQVPAIFILDYYNPVYPEHLGCNEIGRVIRPYKIKDLQEFVTGISS